MSVMQWMFLACLFCSTPASGGGRQYQQLDQSEAESTGNQPIRTVPDVSHIYVVTSCVIFDPWNKSHSMANNSQYFLSCTGTRILIHIMAMIKPKHLQWDEERVFWLNLGVSVCQSLGSLAWLISFLADKEEAETDLVSFPGHPGHYLRDVMWIQPGPLSLSLTLLVSHSRWNSLKMKYQPH